MKDRRNNMEIMDVLSSIRRLVSEDRKAAAMKPAEPAEAAPRDEPPLRRQPEHRFVLTEALRVSEDVEVEEALPEAPAAGAAGDDVASLEDTIAELEAAVAGLSAGFEPDAGEVHENMAAESAPDWVAEDIIRRRPEIAQVLDAQDLIGGQDDIAGLAAGASVAAGLEAAMSAQPRAARLTPTAPTPPAGEGALDDPSVSDETGGGRLHFSSSVARRPMGLRADPSAAGDAPATAVAADAPTDPVAAASEEPVADADEGVSVAADMVQDGAPSGPDADDLFNPLADSDLDIEVLRDLVSEIVRDELRGALGDKITRNLRTMIRREIERALEAQGLKRD